VGVSRISHADTSGYGEVARIGVVTTDNVSGRMMSSSPPVFDTLTFSLSGITIIRHDESLVGYNPLPGVLIIEDTITGISVAQNLAEIKLYPVPAKDMITVSGFRFTAGDEVVVNDIYGRKIYHTTILHSTPNLKLHTSNFRNGIYFITLKTHSGNVVKKFSVMH
jgi:hypothetical protein